MGSIIAGITAGALSEVVIHPLEFARTRIIADIGKK